MAYTIISQNNNTTTLTDGVNTITVPSRVNLTSGNFTIVEVNNNMATLQDGDGNVYRDIPCVATLVDAGGGSALPDQTGHSGEFLTTDGTDASWAAVDALPSQTGNSGKFLTTDGTDASWSNKPLVNSATGAGAVAAGLGSAASSYNSISYGAYANARGRNSICLGGGYASAEWSIVCGISSEVSQSATGAIQLGQGTNSDVGTFKVGLVTSTSPFTSGNYELLSSDGTIPTARFTTDPVSDGTYYPTLTISSGTPTRSWSTISALQNTATGTNSLTISGTATSAAESVNIGMSSSVSGRYSTAIGQWTEVAAEGGTAVGRHASVKSSRGTAVGMQATASSNAQYGIAIGFNTTVAANYAIQLGGIGPNNNSLINSDANTFKVGNVNGNFEMMSADGTIPTARLTKVNSTITLAAADWSSNTQTVTVSGVTSTSVVLVAPDPSDTADYVSAGILCTSQTTDSLTFTATTTPTNDIDVNIVCL